MATGPVQLLLVGLPGTELPAGVRRELERLRGSDGVRVLDVLLVAKDEQGHVAAMPGGATADGAEDESGALTGMLLGLAPAGELELPIAAIRGSEEHPGGHALVDDEVWYAADAIPAGSSAAAVLLEHRWAIALRDAVAAGGARALADDWLDPATLAAAAGRAS